MNANSQCKMNVKFSMKASIEKVGTSHTHCGYNIVQKLENIT